MKKIKNILIISGGDFTPLPSNMSFDYVIACDKGYEHAVRLGITPDIVIGDFDSMDSGIKIPDSIPVEEFPVMKDDTDTMLAIRKAKALGAEQLTIICGLGGRLDHTIANIQSMSFAATNGMECELIGRGEHLRVLNAHGENVGATSTCSRASEQADCITSDHLVQLSNVGTSNYRASEQTDCITSGEDSLSALNSSPRKYVTLKKEKNRALSLFSLSDKCEGLTIKGSLYDVENLTISNNFPIGLGNSWVQDEVTVSIKSGLLLVVLSEKKD